MSGVLEVNVGAKLKVRPERLELPTACSEDKCSVQLSYGRNFDQAVIIFYVSAKESDDLEGMNRWVMMSLLLVRCMPSREIIIPTFFNYPSR